MRLSGVARGAGAGSSSGGLYHRTETWEKKHWIINFISIIGRFIHKKYRKIIINQDAISSENVYNPVP